MIPLSDTMLPDPDRHAEFYADVPTKRAIAWVIDTVLIALITLVLVPLTAFTALFYLVFLFFTVSFLYRLLGLARKSATLGMRLMSIEFRDNRGQSFNLPTAFLHTLGYSVSMGFMPLQLVSIVLMLTTARGQGLTDHVLGTVAMNRAARF